MEDLLKKRIGKNIEVITGITTAFRGDVTEVKDGVLYLRSEDEKAVYVSIDKIAAFYECSDVHQRPGFVG